MQNGGKQAGSGRAKTVSGGRAEQGERVWRRQQQRRRESAFTSGSRLPSTPASRLPARHGAGARRPEAGPSAGLQFRALRAWLWEMPVCRGVLPGPLLTPRLLPATHDRKKTALSDRCPLSSCRTPAHAPHLFVQDLAVQVFSPGTPLRERARRGGAAAAGSHGVLGAVVKVTCGRLGLGWGSGRRVRGRESEPCTEGWRRRLPGVALTEVAKAPELVSEGSQIPPQLSMRVI